MDYWLNKETQDELSTGNKFGEALLSFSFKKPRQWWRQLSLSTQFGLAASVVIGAGMMLLGAWVGHRIEQGVVQNTASAAALYMYNFIEPHVQDLATSDKLSPSAHEALTGLLSETHLGRRVVDIKIWDRAGTLVYSRNTEAVGRKFPLSPRLSSALEGSVESEFDHLDDDENEVERAMGKPLLEIYAPVRESRTGRVIGVAEIYEVADQLATSVRRARAQTAAVVGSLTLLLIACLFGIVSRGSRTIVEQQATLQSRIRDLTALLAQNRELHRRLADATRRSNEANEHFLRRVGADLHDGPAQLISLALLRLDKLLPDEASQSQKQAEEAAHVRDALQDALREIRSLSAGLALPELEGVPIAQALEIVARNHERRTGTKVDVSITNNFPDHLPAIAKLCACRVVQEGLNNACNHGGGVEQKVRARWEKGLFVEVQDSGPGFAVDDKLSPKGGLGILGMRHRIESLGGQLEIRSERGAGTRVTARIPVCDVEVIQ